MKSKIIKASIVFLAIASGATLWSFITDDKPEASKSAGKKPNVVIILADDLGYHDLSSYGNTLINTPNIDALGKEGVKFNQGYVSAAYCSPSRAGLLTGRYQQRFGSEFIVGSAATWGIENADKAKISQVSAWLNKFDVVFDKDLDVKKFSEIKQGLPLQEITIAELLREQGYKTGWVGKWHLGEGGDLIPSKQGFDYSYGILGGGTTYGAASDPQLISRHLSHLFWDKSVFKEKRSGWGAVQQNGKETEVKEYLTSRFGDEAADFIEKNKDNPFFLYLAFNAPHDPVQAKKSDFDLLTSIKDSTQRAYQAQVKSLDDAVGVVTRKLKELNLDNNTIVIFLSDNGGATYTHVLDNKPLRAGKATNFEGGIRVPFFIKYPGVIKGGKDFDQPVSSLDFFTTIAAATGASLPDDVSYDGVNLLPYLKGEKKERPHESLFWRVGFAKAVRKGDYKLYINEKENQTLLFDLKNDVSESHNLASANKEKVEELKQELIKWENSVQPPRWPSVMYMKYNNNGEFNYFPI